MKIIKFVFLSLILFFTSCKRVADFSSDLIRYSLAFDTANLIPQSEILTSGIVSTIAEGESIEIGIKLKEDPKKTLTVNIQTNSPSLLINNLVETSLEFTRENYATEQKVILNAPVDVNSVSESATITFSADGLGEVSKTFTVTDDLTIVVTGNPSSIQEGNSAPVGIKLSKKPTETKTILIQSDKPSLVIDGNSTKSLTFTPDNYSVPQTIQFQTVIDGDSISDSVNITLSMEGIPDINYSLTVLDDITIQVSGVPSTLTELTSANVAVRFSRNLITDNSITITSDNPSLQVNGGSSATLNFTPLNSTADQSFSITAIDDANLSNEVVNLTFSAPGVNDVVVTLTVIDNDTMNFVVSGVPATINEGTISNTMQVSLTQQPGTDYVVNLTTNNLPSLTVSPTTLTFNSGNYNTPQMITLTAPEESNETSEEVTIILTATNAPLQTQKVTVIDNDTRILIGGADSVLEGGEGIITVSLSGSPGIDRTISLNSSNTLAGTITPSSLTFTSSNYSSSITLTGIQDNNAINETTIISGTSTGLLSGNKTISIIDDDTINFDIAGGNQILEGGTLDLQVRLTFSPTSNLTVNINSQNTDAITLNTGTLTFTPTNYNDYQTITLKGEEDANESSESVNINFTATGVPNHTHVVSTIDNDTRPELGGNFTVPEESFSVATVVLSANPGGTKTVYLSSLNTNAVTVSPSSLTFNESNWNSPQSIILSGVADNNVIPEAVTIRAVSGSVQVDQTVNTTDNDTLAMIITDEFGNSIPLGTTIQIDEGTGKKFKVKFNYEPSSTVTVNFSNPLTPSSVQLLNFSPSSLSFNSTNYSTEQTVTITALENDYIDDKTTTAGFHPTGGFSTGRTFNILVKDNDPIVHVRVPGNSAGAGFNPHIFYDPITEFGPFQIFTENSQGDVTSEQILINTACDSNFSCTFGIPSNISSGSNTTNNLKILINTYSEGNPIFSPRFFAVTR
ncbi:MAG: hypothetical protein KDK36_10775, partial [Leptospiraceae bacterium]|nr:hypothetical protein [Leptospiraceae bacterium]